MMREVKVSFKDKLFAAIKKIAVKGILSAVEVEETLIDYSSGKYSAVELGQKHGIATRLIVLWTEIVIGRRVHTTEEAFNMINEYIHLNDAVKTRDTTLFTQDIISHEDEYLDLVDYVKITTGTDVIFMYSPVILRCLKCSVCALFNINYSGKQLIIYDDIFKRLLDIDRKCYSLHEVGHLKYGHLNMTDDELSHEPGKIAKNVELQADDYAACIIGSANMKKALMRTYVKYGFISRLLNKKELFHRMKELG